MKIHPTISKYINLLKEAGILKVENNERKLLTLLKENGATQTEAIIVLHLGYNNDLGEGEKMVFSSNVWDREDLQDIAYQTFLYMNYNPDDPNYYSDENSVKFSLKTPPDQ